MLLHKSARGSHPSPAGAMLGPLTIGPTAANTLQLTNCQWGGPADANGIAELVILTKLNA